jgi:anti-sigma factor (TIGR02949 family)
MNVVNFNERSCGRYRRYFDAYLDNELLVETNQDLLQHLESCAECARILDGIARTKRAVRNAVETEAAPAELAAAIRERISSRRPGFFANENPRRILALAAVLLLAVVGVATIQWSPFKPFGGDEGVFTAVSARLQALYRIGLVDHVHCAILSQRWKKPVSFDQMEAATGRQALGPEFIGLAPVIQAKLGSDYKMVQGHRCIANGRQYIHFILTGKNGAILSIVMTEKNNESFAQTDAVAVVEASGIKIYRDRQGSTEIAGFESAKYLAYVVSNLDRDSNLKVASLMAPVLYSHLSNLEL